MKQTLNQRQQRNRRALTAAGPGRPSVRLDGLHVLVVDDEADAREMLVKVLEAVGAHVTTAASASDALCMLPKRLRKVRLRTS